MINAAQCRAARGLLDWTQERLSERTREVEEAGLSRVSIRNFERGGDMRPGNRRLLRLVFEEAGVVFIDPGADGGPGMRLKDAP